MSGSGQGAPAAIAAGFGEGRDWQEALGQVRAALAEAGGTATTGVVYVSDNVADRLPEIVEALTADTGITDWAGTVGMGVCGTGRAAFGRPAVAAAAFDFPQAAVRLVPGVRDDAGEAGAGLAGWAAGQARTTALLHADPRNQSMGEIVADLSETLGAFTVGGIASAEGRTAQLAGTVEEGVVSGLVFGEAVRVVSGLSQGCTPIGPARTVTRSHNNLVVEIDGEPAFDVLCSDLGFNTVARIREAAPWLHAARPVPGSSEADYLVRNIIGLDAQDGIVALGALIDPGERLIFVRRDPAAAEADLRRMLRGAKARLSGPAQGGVYVSCLARGPHMFGSEDRELEIVREEVGDLPLAGFFANGEFSGGRIYGYTGVITLFE
ncbi:MAG: FIST C-terminal domain-containing protein [Alphaproteobacteria bacterium]|nr:FIST C-terminal domain-containing protein [Alphaproteobacteria bacterium]